MFIQLMVLLFRRHPSPDMPFGFINIQYLPGLCRQRRIDPEKTLRDVLMYRALAHAKLTCRLSDRCLVAYNISGNGNSTFFNR